MTALLTTEDLLVLIGSLGVGALRDVDLLDSAAHRPGRSATGLMPIRRSTSKRRHYLNPSSRTTPSSTETTGSDGWAP